MKKRIKDLRALSERIVVPFGKKSWTDKNKTARNKANGVLQRAEQNKDRKRVENQARSSHK
jgi:hypothetical protein